VNILLRFGIRSFAQAQPNLPSSRAIFVLILGLEGASRLERNGLAGIPFRINAGG